jgi:hypothetical protein
LVIHIIVPDLTSYGPLSVKTDKICATILVVALLGIYVMEPSDNSPLKQNATASVPSVDPSVNDNTVSQNLHGHKWPVWKTILWIYSLIYISLGFLLFVAVAIGSRSSSTTSSQSNPSTQRLGGILALYLYRC